MPDNFIANPGSGGSTFAADEIGVVLYPRSKITLGADGIDAGDVSASNPMPVTGSVTVSNMVAQGLTDAQLRAAAVPVSGSVSVSNMVAQGLTDTQLRATPVPVSGTFWQATQPVSIASMPSTPVTGTFWQATQPVSAASLPLPTGAATETTLAALNTKMPAQGQALMAASQPVVIASNQSAVPVSGTFWQATQPVSGSVTATQAVGSAATRWFAQISDGTNSPAVKAASTAAAATDPALTVAISPNNGVAITGTGGLAATKASGTAAATTDIAQVVTISPNLPVPTQSFVNSAATTNATSVKASAGTVYNITASNTGAAAAFVKFYNKASAPTVGTDVPVFTMSIPASGTVTIAPAMIGIRFGTGIALAITNLAADTDTTAVAANQVKVATSYI